MSELRLWDCCSPILLGARVRSWLQVLERAGKVQTHRTAISFWVFFICKIFLVKLCFGTKIVFFPLT